MRSTPKGIEGKLTHRKVLKGVRMSRLQPIQAARLQDITGVRRHMMPIKRLSLTDFRRVC